MFATPSKTAAVVSLPYKKTHRPPVFIGVLLLVFSCLWGGLPTAHLVSSLSAGTLRAQELPFLLFTIIGTGLFFVALHLLVYRKEVVITERAVAVKKRTLFGVTQWIEDLKNYEGVRATLERRRQGNTTRTVGILELYHAEKAKRVCLFELPSPQNLRASLEATCKTLGLPALEQQGGEISKREVEDLDKSVKELAKENKLTVSFDPSAPVPAGLDLAIDRETGTLTVTVSKKRLPLLAFIIAFSVPAVFVYVGFFVEEVPSFFGVVGALFGLLLLWALTWEIIRRERITLRSDGVRLSRVSPWGERAEAYFPAEKVEEVRVGTHPQYGRGVIIATDQGEKLIGRYLSPEARTWLRNCILAVLTR